jgi:hypothetical protein
MKSPQCWTARTIDVRSGRGIPEGDAWLSPAERDECAHWRDPSRHRDWRAGRALLKSMIRAELARRNPALSLPPCSGIEVLSRDALGRGVRPRACVAGRWLPWDLSLAHCDGIVSAVLAPAMNIRVGIDVVTANTELDASRDLWFTPGERRRTQSTSQIPPPLLWAAKEAVYKRTNRGEPFVPTAIDVEPQAGGRCTWSCRGRPCSADDMLHFFHRGDWIVALAAAGAGSFEWEGML